MLAHAMLKISILKKRGFFYRAYFPPPTTSYSGHMVAWANTHDDDYRAPQRRLYRVVHQYMATQVKNSRYQKFFMFESTPPRPPGLQNGGILASIQKRSCGDTWRRSALYTGWYVATCQKPCKSSSIDEKLMQIVSIWFPKGRLRLMTCSKF